jgi:hypothetical protein
MKLKAVLFVSSMLLAGVTSSNAAQYQLLNLAGGPGVDTLWANADGSLMNGTGTVAIGYWAAGVTTADIDTIAELVPLLASFTSQQAAIPGISTNFPAPGFLNEDPFLGATITGVNTLIGKGIYVIATSAASLVAATTADAFSLFYVRDIQDDVPLEQTYTGNPATGTVIIGSIGSFDDAANSLGVGAGVYSTLELVPEPSAALLGALGALGLLRRRRN